MLFFEKRLGGKYAKEKVTNILKTTLKIKRNFYLIFNSFQTQNMHQF